MRRTPPSDVAGYLVVTIVVVIVIAIVPISIAVPAMIVFVPPPAVRLPATLPRFAQLVAGILGLVAPVSVMFNGPMQSVVGAGYSMLTIVVIRMQSRNAYQSKTTRQRHGRRDLSC